MGEIEPDFPPLHHLLHHHHHHHHLLHHLLHHHHRHPHVRAHHHCCLLPPQHPLLLCPCQRQPYFHFTHHHHHHHLTPSPVPMHHFPLPSVSSSTNLAAPNSAPVPLSGLSFRPATSHITPEVGHDVGGYENRDALSDTPGFQHQDWTEEVELEEEGGEDVFVLTDEWMEFFAKSEAKRRMDKQQKHKKGSK